MNKKRERREKRGGFGAGAMVFDVAGRTGWGGGFIWNDVLFITF